jgi:hypothetical protein
MKDVEKADVCKENKKHLIFTTSTNITNRRKENV